ncbi:MAG: DUF2730 family protein [Pseudotabrizicola sp.]|uniref:DUF2730 family protein n=1 Tax=Pseudotabrizicola sp. TaxID=2939647 RepID=UPI00271AD9AE|nr:DUF2730 family protein [Pseudotabrizicola sp.]MDO9639670.1 DUF2730 family protein [Pseudotabrizicola sp.]
MTPADTSLANLILWAAGLLTLFNFGSVIWMVFSGPSRRNSSKLDDHTARLDRMDQRVASVEQTLRSMPGKDDIHQVQLALSDMRGDLKNMQTSMDGNMKIMQRLETIVIRHEDHLLGGNKR